MAQQSNDPTSTKSTAPNHHLSGPEGYRLEPAPRDGGFRQDGYWVWCGSVVRGDDQRYHMFASRWPKTIAFHPGWMTNSEIVRAVADHPEGPYKYEEIVLPARGAEYWDGRAAHNPSIIRHESKYLLFYTGITHPLAEVLPGDKFTTDDARCIVARSNKRIGLAIADSVFGPWTRMDQPILPTRPNTFYSFLTSNPAPCVHKDGSVFMIFKSRQYQGNSHSSMTLGAAHSRHFAGPYEVVSDGPIFSRDHFGEVEDPFVWADGDGYRMIAKDMQGSLCGERHAGIEAYSPNGLRWQLADSPKAYSRRIRWRDGVTQTMGSFERPSLLFHDGRPTHLFAAVADGPGGFENASQTWNMVIPLAKHDPVA